MPDQDALTSLRKLYAERKQDIEERLGQFRMLWESGSEEVLFDELVFCLLTPQSRARACWAAVESLHSKGLLMTAGVERLSAELGRVRFRNNKARYIVSAREMFGTVKQTFERFADAAEAREWLAGNVRGLGYKEASHFLRNIGLGEDLAILDRHILRNLAALGVIPGVPASMSRKRYLEIETRMHHFSKSVDIPMAHLDLLLWLRETGEIFK